MPTYTTVFLDFGGTLAPDSPVSCQERIRRTYAERGFRDRFELTIPDEDELLGLHDQCTQRAGWPVQPPWSEQIERFYAEWAKLLLIGLGASAEAAAEHAADFADQFLDLSNATRILYPDAADTLGQLAAAGLRLAIVSNNNGRLAGRVAYLGVADLFEAVIDSAVVRSNKPDPAIFRCAMEAMNVHPDEILHVGDSYPADVEGASALGIDAAWIKRGDAEPPADPIHRPRFVVHQLAELPALLGRRPDAPTDTATART